jgi:hypothetical protein
METERDRSINNSRNENNNSWNFEKPSIKTPLDLSRDKNPLGYKS